MIYGLLLIVLGIILWLIIGGLIGLILGLVLIVFGIAALVPMRGRYY
jgi:hypothetical protein